MKKIIKRYGNANVITFSTEEMKVYKLEHGDVIDIEIKENKDGE